MTNDEQETVESLYNLLRAVVFKFGRDVTLTKEEFMQSLATPLSIQHVPQDEVTYLRVWHD